MKKIFPAKKSNLNRIIDSLKYLINCYIFRKKTLKTKELINNLTIHLLPEDVIGRHIYKYGIYEEEETLFLCNHLKLNKNDIIIDIGANIGWYTLQLGKTFQTQVLAFEPDPDNFALLEKNIRTNKIKNNAYPYAISNTCIKKHFYQYKNKNRGRHSLIKTDNYKSIIEVNTITLNQFLKEKKIDINKIKFLKIDIEGHEYEALKGATDLLKTVPAIFSEFSPSIMLKNKTNPLDYIDLLTHYKFKPFFIQHNKLLPIKIDILKKETSQYNIFWKK